MNPLVDLPPTEWLMRKMAQNLHIQTATWLVSRGLTEDAGPSETRMLGTTMESIYFGSCWQAPVHASRPKGGGWVVTTRGEPD